MFSNKKNNEQIDDLNFFANNIYRITQNTFISDSDKNGIINKLSKQYFLNLKDISLTKNLYSYKELLDFIELLFMALKDMDISWEFDAFSFNSSKSDWNEFKSRPAYQLFKSFMENSKKNTQLFNINTHTYTITRINLLKTLSDLIYLKLLDNHLARTEVIIIMNSILKKIFQSANTNKIDIDITFFIIKVFFNSNNFGNEFLEFLYTSNNYSIQQYIKKNQFSQTIKNILIIVFTAFITAFFTVTLTHFFIEK